MSNYMPLSIVIVVAAALSGCRPSGVASPSKTNAAAQPTGGVAITRDSSPEDVAKLLIAAIEKSDTAVLAQLVASQHVRSDTQRITQGRKQFAKVVDNGDALAIVGWRAKFSFLKSGSAKVASHSIDGERATVLLEAVNKQDEPVSLEVNLVREADLWKVMPGIK
jgi:pyruvate/2-oxoglutarate/acetoin dehydrogenase E1 component